MAVYRPGRLTVDHYSEVNKRNMIVPASSYASAMHDSSEDDDAEFRNLQFPQEVALQQVSNDGGSISNRVANEQSPAFKFRFVFFSFKTCVISAVCRLIWLKFDTCLT